MSTLDPATVAEKYVSEIRNDIATLDARPRVVGLIASTDKPSQAYARATKQKFDDVGIDYVLKQVERLELENEINRLNDNPEVHGIFIYFPVFHNQQDDYLRNQVDYRKDIEAGSIYWTRKLYANDRLAIQGDEIKKALLPCTPLAIVKILSELSIYTKQQRPLEGKTVTIFNRSEVIGRPLAVMMSNDGARVYSFDVNGPLEFIDAVPNECNITRELALKNSDIVITGVPSTHFEKIRRAEIRSDSICLNFASIQNFDDDVNNYAKIVIPRVGPMTVAMCMRNTLRLYANFHQKIDPSMEQVI